MIRTNKIISTIITAVLAVSAVSTSVFAEAFRDVPANHWAYKAVERCNDTNWFSGYPDGTFRPDGKITRAEAAKVFVTFMGEPLPEVTTTSFHDVKPTDWAAPFIEAGKDLFPARKTLTSQPKFQPDMPITREDAMYALVTALNYDQKVKNADQSVLNMFSDQNSISAVCKPYMAVAVTNGIVSGYADGTIGAQDPLTRAQFATILYRATFVGALEEPNKVMQKIEIEPSTVMNVKVGENVTFKATAYYSDGSTEDYSSKLTPYTDDGKNIVSFNKNVATAVTAGTTVVKFNDSALADKNVVIVVEAVEETKTEKEEEKKEEGPVVTVIDEEEEEATATVVDKEEEKATTTATDEEDAD